MTNENLLPFDPNKVPDLIKTGRIKVVTAPTVPVAISAPEQTGTSDPMIERAQRILGKDFLGPKSVIFMQKKLNAVGVDVEFNIDSLPPIPYDEQDLQLASQNGEMLVLRAGAQRLNGTEEQITVMNFRELFRRDPNSKLDTPFYSFRSGANDWYPSENFAAQPGEIQLGWALVKKDVLANSKNKKWDKQEELLRKYGEELEKKGATNTQVSRRTAMEVTWDTMLYYVHAGEQLLPGVYDWTKSRASHGYLVYVGHFDSRGLRVGRWYPEDADEGIGVCPAR